MPQLTVKAIVTGVLLSIILSWANAYIGLFAGLTVSASIPRRGDVDGGAAHVQA